MTTKKKKPNGVSGNENFVKELKGAFPKASQKGMPKGKKKKDKKSC